MTFRRTYLDHNATTPLRPEARAAMLAALGVAGNPSSVHAEGRRARALVEDAREQVAAAVNAKPAEVVFTAGATEANNWVLAGDWDTMIVSALEHDSVLGPARRCKTARVRPIPARYDGRIDLDRLAAELGPKPSRALLCVQMANNETGAIQDIEAIAQMARASGFALHTDAVQALGKIAVDFKTLGSDTISLSAHKIGGPK
ncbi:MAG: cysteine desulfurase family protein, partial [Hyphomicrobiaceae bacterium]